MYCWARKTLFLVFKRVAHGAAQRCQDCIESTERPFPRLRGPVTLTQVDGPPRGWMDIDKSMCIVHACLIVCIWLYTDYQRTYDIYYTVYTYIYIYIHTIWNNKNQLLSWSKITRGHLEWFLVTVVIWAMKKTAKLVGLYGGWIKNYPFIYIGIIS